jgi:hypothetical protein
MHGVEIFSFAKTDFMTTSSSLRICIQSPARAAHVCNSKLTEAGGPRCKSGEKAGFVTLAGSAVPLQTTRSRWRRWS